MHERDIVGAVAQMREEIADILATVAPLTKLPARLNDAALVLVPAASERFYFDRLAVHPDHRRLKVERVDMAWAAVHEEKDDAFGLRREQGCSGGERIG